MSKNSPGYYVDFSFNYSPELDSDVSVNFSVLIGHTLGEAYEMFKFIANHNMWIPGLIYIRLRLVDEDHQNGTVLSRRTPSGMGDW